MKTKITLERVCYSCHGRYVYDLDIDSRGQTRLYNLYLSTIDTIGDSTYTAARKIDLHNPATTNCKSLGRLSDLRTKISEQMKKT